MFPRILKLCREKVLSREYIIPIHALDELQNDNLTIYDIERGILTGNILERQKDEISSEWKYRLEGLTLDEVFIELIVKIGPTGKLVIITAYITNGEQT